MSSQAEQKESSAKVCLTCPSTIAPEQPEWAKQCMDCFKDDRTKRNCKVCEKPKIVNTEPEWKTVCGACFKESPMKRCVQCKEFNIKAFEWRKMCKECFEKGDFARPCQVCKIRPVDPGAATYIVNCTKCYLEKKKQTHDACPWCPNDPSKRFTLNKRKGAPACRSCMISKDLIKLNSNIEAVGA